MDSREVSLAPITTTEHDIDIKAVKAYVEEKKLDEELVGKWGRQTEELLNKHGKDFGEFTKNHEELVAEGDRVLAEKQGTGYNIHRFDINDGSPLEPHRSDVQVQYSCAIDRPEHFALLLAGLEQEEIIKPENVSLGARATKVGWAPSWDLTSSEVVKNPITRIDDSVMETASTVETVVRFEVNEAQAVKIMVYLTKHTYLNGEDPIPGSWDIPDIRMTTKVNPEVTRRDDAPLPQYIEGTKAVIANQKLDKGGSLTVLREESSLDAADGDWNTLKVGVNEPLAGYLKGFGVKA